MSETRNGSSNNSIRLKKFVRKELFEFLLILFLYEYKISIKSLNNSENKITNDFDAIPVLYL